MLVVEIIGNLGSDAVIKDFNGQKYIAFNMAHSESYKDANGNKVEKTIWVSCLKKGDSAVINYLKKGTKVFVRGEYNSKIYYLTNNAQPQIAHNCQVREVQLLSTVTTTTVATATTVAKQQQTAPTEEELQQRRETYRNQYDNNFVSKPTEQPLAEESQEDDDLPF
jgi:single-strand DNA-binding protein